MGNKQDARNKKDARNKQDARNWLLGGAFAAAPRPLTYQKQMALGRNRIRLTEKEERRYVDLREKRAAHKQRSLEREERIEYGHWFRE
jgi:hypothetical protein